MKTFRYNLMVVLLCCSAAGMAQSKLQETFRTNPDVSVVIDARHTNVIVENWDRNEVEIEAYLEGDDSEERTRQEQLDAWKLQTSGNAREVRITSGGGTNSSFNMDMTALNAPMAKLPEMMEPLMNMMGPLLKGIANNPLPPGMFENMGDLDFDYEAYQEDGDAYMKEWEKKIEEKFGEDFEVKMEKWSQNFKSEMSQEMEDSIEKSMEKWGEEFEVSMEEWGEEFGKSMESWGQQFGKQMAVQFGKEGTSETTARAKRTIKVKMPHQGRVELIQRHGNVQLKGEIKNLQAELSHSNLSAQTISGDQTRVRASYTPIKIGQWNYGVLNTSYVPSCQIETVKSLKLTSNSSELEIGEILETAIITGTFGKLDIDGLGASFQTVDLTLENSDLSLRLPKSALIFNYNGSQSNLDYPGSIQGTSQKNYDSEIINGFQKSRDTRATVNIKAEYSNVNIK